MSAKSLIDLLRAYGAPAECSEGAEHTPIHDITSDSRQVKAGTAFVAVPGVAADGAQFIPQAIAAGAAAIIASEFASDAVPCVRVGNPRLALAKMAAALYAPQPKHIAAITGTDGKTSTADFYRQLSGLLGHKSASIGTLGTLGENRAELAPGINTTPDPAGLARMLAQLAQDGYTHVGLEASSHGLHQFRLDGVELESAAFTNLTRDHLDYHGTEEEYFQAKLRLFSEVLPTHATAVVNAEDARFAAIKAIAAQRRLRLISFGKGLQDLSIVSIRPTPEGQTVHLNVFGRFYALDLPLVGSFQVYNMLAALGLLAGAGENPNKIIAHFPVLACVPGRLERVGLHKGAAVYIDYAHTPAALANVLTTLRPHTEKRLIVVFGCGGDRDKGKRPLMADAAGKLADVVVVTDDNPRTEEAAQIRREVLSGYPTAKEVADRRDAIYGAVAMLGAGDVLLVAGKGHEKTQIIGGVSHPFDDAEVIREAIARQ